MDGRMIAKTRKLLATLALCLSFAPLVLPIAGLGGVALAAADEPSREYRIKAAFIYNFAKFTHWPDSSFPDVTAPLEFCVFGEDPFGGALNSIAGKTIRGRKVAVRRVASVEDGAGCHLLFISASELPRLGVILEALTGRPVLTVADMPDFARVGGIISLKTNEQDRLRFEINTGIAKRAGLRISSKLLSLAEIAPN
jgi:hypothetical protein